MHFDNEVDMADLERFPSIEVDMTVWRLAPGRQLLGPVSCHEIGPGHCGDHRATRRN